MTSFAFILGVLPLALSRGAGSASQNAIGTGVACLPADAVEVHRLIRELAPAGTHVLYGGSVDPTNVASFTALPEVDGVLVGGASTVAAKVRAMLTAMSQV